MSVDTTMIDAAFDAADATSENAEVTELTEALTETTAATAEVAQDVETADADAAPAVPEAAPVLDTGTEVTFASLELPKPLLGVLNEAGLVTAFPIQAATIPDAMVGRDVLGRGRTGSGKTLAFGLPTLTRLEGLRAKPRRPLALVLVPTRELAMQVEDALRPYARALHLRIRSVYGGAPMRKQIDGLRYGVEMLVATPGRLSDLIERGECELNEVDVAILDEADQMCDMGFLPHVCELMDQVAEGGQRLLFSATLDGAVDEIVKKYMNDPVLHEVDPHAGAVSTMSHHLLMVTPQHKAKVAAQIAGRHSTEGGKAASRSLFFVRTQMAVDRVTEQLRERGLPAAGLHGGMTQVARTKTLEDFKEGRTPLLIATDVAARGIHVDGIDLVVHLDPARDSKDYLHRAGRTARAGQAGVVASLVLPKQRKQAQRLMDDAGVTAEEIDAAPLGAGPKWDAAGVALTELTGAREVPEPGDVTPFKLPVRERDRDRDRPFRSGERRDGDRYGRGRDDRRGGGFGGGFGGGGSRGFGGESRPSGSGSGYARRDGERFERPKSDSRDSRGEERRSAPADRGFERRDGERDSRDFGRSDRPARTFERRDGDRYGRDVNRDRDDRRGSASAPSAGRSFEGRDTRPAAGRGYEDRNSQRRPVDGRGGSEGRGYEGRRFEGGRPPERGVENRGTGERGFGERGRERSGESRPYSDRYDRDRKPRPASSWDRAKPQHTSRDGKPRS